jgi:hypothetical protein
VKRKKLLATGLVFLLFFIASVATFFVRLAQANPNPFLTYTTCEEIPAPKYAKPPEISLLSPMNQSFHSSNNIVFSVDVSFSGKTLWYDTIYGMGKHERVSINPSLKEVYFEADWRRFNTSVELNHPINLSLSGIPDGKHSIIVHAVGWSPHNIRHTEPYGLGKLLRYTGYNITGSLVIIFTVDTLSPQTSILSLENKSYNTVDVPLNFTVNEAVSEIAYSLDGQENVTITGNTTLTDLSYGDHNVTVYATDMCGHVGASETIYFTITEPFPTASVTAASVASVAVVSMVLLVYFKKRKH